MKNTISSEGKLTETIKKVVTRLIG